MLEVSLKYEKQMKMLNPNLNTYAVPSGNPFTQKTGMEMYINSIGKLPPTPGSKNN
jgi:hypothetical protein